MSGGAAGGPSPQLPHPTIGLKIGKFRLDAQIGEGGQGLVYLATDTELNRLVALKILRPKLAQHLHVVQRFLAEARRTSSLAHSGIPAIHEFGTSREGMIYFAMELIHGPTLWDILDGLRRRDASVEDAWPLARLIQVLSSASRALHHAHMQGLVHRDVKPSNISLGRGEDVLVLDWGLAKRFRPAADGSEEDLEATRAGAVMGTPLYISPEQAAAGVAPIDPRTDVFALGAVLYETLCLQPPYDATDAGELLRLARSGGILPPMRRGSDREIPPQLSEIAMRALAVDPDDRHASAEEFARELDEFAAQLDRRNARREQTSGMVRRAVGLAGRFQRLREELSAAEEEAARMRTVIPDWAPVSQKASLWSAEAHADVLRLDTAETLSSAVELVTRCLLENPQDTRAQRLSETLYAAHLDWAERLGDTVLTTAVTRRLEGLNEGTPTHTGVGDGTVLLQEIEPDARVGVVRFVETDRRLVSEPILRGSASELGDLSLPAGSYLFVVTLPGHATARVPLVVHRSETLALTLRAPPSGRVPEGFVWISAGAFLAGRRPHLRTEQVNDFVIGRTPVAIGDYVEWLDELLATDPEEAALRAPRTVDRGPMLMVVDGRHVAASTTDGDEPPAPPPHDYPVVGISREDAQSYATWLGDRIGRLLRLPTQLEWEKAARGVDGRLFPWGDQFDATFCSMAHSTHKRPRVRSIGSAETDESPYGVRDMAGGVSEWCSDRLGVDGAVGVHRGGSWLSHADACTVLEHRLLPPTSRVCDVGFRLAADV